MQLMDYEPTDRQKETSVAGIMIPSTSRIFEECTMNPRCYLHKRTCSSNENDISSSWRRNLRDANEITMIHYTCNELVQLWISYAVIFEMCMRLCINTLAQHEELYLMI